MFQLGELPHGAIAVLLGYAGQRASGRVLESFVIGMSRDQARLLADALVRLADEPSGGSPQRRH
jgi:hypothetical protein